MIVQFKEDSSEKNDMKKHSKQQQQQQKSHKERKNQMENIVTLAQASGCDFCWKQTAVLDNESTSCNPTCSPHL